MSFIESGSRSKLSWCTKTTNSKSLRTLFRTSKTKRPSCSRKSPGSMTIIELLREKLKKSKSISKVFNRKWTSSTTILLSTATRSPNLKTKISTLSLNSFKNSRKWNAKQSSLRSTLTKSDKKKQNWWTKLSSVKDKSFCGKESIN